MRKREREGNAGPPAKLFQRRRDVKSEKVTFLFLVKDLPFVVYLVLLINGLCADVMESYKIGK